MPACGACGKQRRNVAYSRHYGECPTSSSSGFGNGCQYLRGHVGTGCSFGGCRFGGCLTARQREDHSARPKQCKLTYAAGNSPWLTHTFPRSLHCSVALAILAWLLGHRPPRRSRCPGSASTQSRCPLFRCRTVDIDVAFSSKSLNLEPQAPSPREGWSAAQGFTLRPTIRLPCLQHVQNRILLVTA